MVDFNSLIEGLIPVSISSNKTVKIFKIDSPISSFPHPIALKQLYCSSLELESDLLKEAQLQIDNPHPLFCQCILAKREENLSGTNGFFLYFAFPWMESDLQKEIDKRAVRSSQNPIVWFPEATLWRYLRELVSAFAFLQRKRIVHRDIKPGNILVDSKDNIKLSDFRFAKQIDGSVSSTLLGSKPYLSPKLRIALIQGATDLDKVEHDPIKSDVYSLGVTMAHLTDLELHDEFTSIKKLREQLEIFFSEITNYSPAWISVLRYMLEADEDQRMDFIQLEQKIAEIDPHLDDGLLRISPIAETLIAQLSVSMKLGLSCIRISPTNKDIVPCVVSVGGLELSAAFQRHSVDIVCAVDLSGSMEHERLDLVKSSLFRLLSLLQDRDRVCLIGFSDLAQRMCQLTACTEDGKRTISSKINCLNTGDLTNIRAGFELAMEVISRGRRKTSHASLLLFSDGKDNCGGENANQKCLQILREKAVENLSVHCFGIGTEIDVDFLHSLAIEGKGKYYAIENEDSFSSAFASLTSIVASDISICVRAPPNQPIAYRISQEYDRNRSLRIPPISAKEKSHFLFLIDPQNTQATNGNILTVEMQVSYSNREGGKQSAVMQVTAQSIPWTDAEPSQNSDVFVRLDQAKGFQCLTEARELSKKNQLEAAQSCLQTGIESLSLSRYAQEPILQAIIDDMKRCLRLLENKEEWNQERSAQMAEIWYKHYLI